MNKRGQRRKRLRHQVLALPEIIPSIGWCSDCGKRAFTEDNAKEVAEVMTWRRVRWYPCPVHGEDAGWWHVSRMSWLTNRELYGDKRESNG